MLAGAFDIAVEELVHPGSDDANLGAHSIMRAMYTTPEQELELTQSCLRAAGVGLWRRDLKTNTMWYSDSWAYSLGYSAKELPADIDAFWRFIHADDTDRVQSQLNACLSGQTDVFHAEYRVRRRDGTWLWVRCTGSLLGGVKGARSVLAGVQIVKADSEQSDFLNQILDAIPNSILVKDRNLRYTHANRAALEVLGMPATDLLGKADAEVYPNKTRAEQLRKDDERVLTEAKRLDTTEEIQTPDELTRLFRTTKVPLVVAGEVHGVIAVSLDVSEWEHNEWLPNMMVEELPDGVFCKDREGRYVRVNRWFSHFVGAAQPEELIGKTDFDFFHWEYAQSVLRDEQDVMKTGQSLIHDMRSVRRPDGETTLVLQSRLPLQGRDGQTIGVLGTLQDATGLAERLSRSEMLGEGLPDVNAQVIAVGDTHALCWVEISPGTRVKTSIPLSLLEDVGHSDGTRFVWSLSKNVARVS